MTLTQVTQVEEGNTITSSPTPTFSETKLDKQRARKWCFTLFNYNNDTKLSILKLKNCQYIFGEEICPTTNRKHLQGYLEFKNPVFFSSIQKQFPGIHLEKTRGSLEDNYNYCSKENNYQTNIKIKKNVIHASDDEKDNLYPWQTYIIENVLNKPIDKRKIYWIYDKNGNNGKSWLCKHILNEYNKCIYFTGGKSSDITSQILLCEDYDPEICLFDLPRTSEGKVSYNGIEQCKNGLVNSGKYKGGFKLFKHPHVFIFANYKPDLNSLSLDRWNIFEIKNKELSKVGIPTSENEEKIML